MRGGTHFPERSPEQQKRERKQSPREGNQHQWDQRDRSQRQERERQREKRHRDDPEAHGEATRAIEEILGGSGVGWVRHRAYLLVCRYLLDTTRATNVTGPPLR